MFIGLSVKMWKNFEELKDPESKAFQTYGFYLEDVAIDEVSRPIAIISAQLNQIRVFMIIGLLIFCSDYSWLQL